MMLRHRTIELGLSLVRGGSAASVLSAPSLLAAGPSIIESRALVHHHMERGDLKLYLGIKMRARKTVAIEVPEWEDSRKTDEMSAAELRVEMLRRGINPYRDLAPRQWQEQQITYQSFYGVIDPYVSPGSGLPSLPTSVTGLSEAGTDLKDRALHGYRSWQYGTKKIKNKKGVNFDKKAFGATAETIYKEAHEMLMRRDKRELLNRVTEHAFPVTMDCEVGECAAFQKLWADIETGSVVWRHVEWLEPSTVVSVRCYDNPPGSGNEIAQVIVRMHSRQILALYDRFGKLLLGSSDKARDVLEYVVFENHIAVVGSKWRMHDKIYPKWIGPKEGSLVARQLGENESEQWKKGSQALSLAKGGKSDKEGDKAAQE